jgi:sterol desaturase/sphingolipid hydroxylase (fatty acid hydroxylase superfamily)
MLVSIIFIALLLIFISAPKRRMMLYHKKLHEWVLDLTGLSIQGTLIPILQTLVIVAFLKMFFPSASGIINIGVIPSFLINFVIVDYLYYWNHRILHTNFLWSLHRIHHSVTQFDVMATSRNSVWSSFLIIYMWVNSISLFLLKDPSGYILAMGLTAGLDIWRHSQLETNHYKLETFFSRYLFLITPREHAGHHDNRACFNFGANFNIYDKIHGTYATPHKDAWNKLGIENHLGLARSLFFPFDSSSTKRKK